jgi:EAL domain-containing protein (putative c-di-GMP-specific phosphodiesterase class I)
VAAGRPSTAPAADPSPAAVPGRSWRAAIEAALDDPVGRVDLVFQPVVDLGRGTVVGYEALARFAGPPQAGPGRWFTEARHEGLAARLEAVVLALALARRASLPARCFLAVNLSPTALPSGEVQAVLRRAGDLSATVVELTEHSRVDDPDRLVRDLDRIRAAGGRVAADDAGAGYTALQRLLALRPDVVKLDRSLVAQIDEDPVKRAFVEMLRSLTGDTGARLLAQGIERVEELEALARLGVPLGQGFLLARPGPPWPGVGAGLRRRLRTG